MKLFYNLTKWIAKWTKWLGIFGKESHYLNTNFEETHRGLKVCFTGFLPRPIVKDTSVFATTSQLPHFVTVEAK